MKEYPTTVRWSYVGDMDHDTSFEDRFELGADVLVHVDGLIGPRRLDPLACDLLNVAASICQVERLIPSWRTSNRPIEVGMRVPVSRVRTWERCQSSLCQILLILTGTPWRIEFRRVRERDLPQIASDRCSDPQTCSVVLFSGGLDSACGAALCSGQAASCQLVSSYAREKGLQRELAAALGHSPPIQSRVRYIGGRRCTLTRSLLYLSTGAVVAQVRGAGRLVQYENGVLGNSVAPAPGLRMTRHAHPRFHEAVEQLLASLFTEQSVQIENPFIQLTKRECVDRAVGELANAGVKNPRSTLLAKTQSCWFHWSNHSQVGDKTPGRPCGVCIPCLVRRTALADNPEAYCFDALKLARHRLSKKRKLASHFFDWLGFFDRLELCADEFDFYDILTPRDRPLVGGASCLSLGELYNLYQRFRLDFVNVFQLKS